jgi:hypothetical protein
MGSEESNHEQTLFRALRNFAFAHWPRCLHAFAVFLIFASPVLATLHFYPTLDHFNKVTNYVPSFALIALSAIIFYKLSWYFFYYDQEPWGGPDLLELPRHVGVLVGIAIVLLIVGVILSPKPL